MSPLLHPTPLDCQQIGFNHCTLGVRLRSKYGTDAIKNALDATKSSEDAAKYVHNHQRILSYSLIVQLNESNAFIKVQGSS